MRIISQDGRTDIPYENFCFGITKDNSIVAIRDTIARPSEIANGVVATYSKEEKSKKAMEMLRKAYVGMPILFQNVEITEDVVKQFEKLKNSGIIVQTMNNEPSKVEYVNNCIFQFPKDDEIEVET